MQELPGKIVFTIGNKLKLKAREARGTHRTTGIPQKQVDLRSVPLEAVDTAYKTNLRNIWYQAAYELYHAAQASRQPPL